MKKILRLIFNAKSDKKYGARDMENMSIPYILQCTIQYNVLWHAIRLLSVYCVGIHALGFPEFRATKAE